MGRYTMGDTVRDVIISSYCSYPIKSSSQKYKIKKCAAAFGAAHFFFPPTHHTSAVTVAVVTVTVASP